MFYKEWSCDNYWLPQGGLSLLPEGTMYIITHSHNFMFYCFYVECPIPVQTPRALIPFFDPDSLKKMETTLRKVSAYLDKANAAEWWKTWMADAKKNTTIQIPGDLEGKNSM